jgi:hypothetical protein
MVLTVPALPEIVIYPSDSEIFSANGAWRRVDDTTAAGGARLQHPNAGARKVVAPLAEPTNYISGRFFADPRLEYKLWIRGKAENDFYENDSVFVQFEGAADAIGAPRYQVGTASALTFNLEECAGCGLRSWGWEDDGWGAKDLNGVLLRFPRGMAVIVIQTREDGLSIDQVVLSAVRYRSTRPGAAKGDHTILPSTTSP